MPRKKSPAKTPAKQDLQSVSNTVLDTDGQQTPGLKSGKATQAKKEVSRYQVQPQIHITGQFEQEKKTGRTKTSTA